MAEDLGVRWGDPKTRSSYASRWREEQRAMLVELGLAAASAPTGPGDEDDDRRVDRDNLRKIVDALAVRIGKGSLRHALAELETVDRPVSLRNRAVHSFKPLSRQE